MNRLLLVGFAAMALSMAACSDNNDNGNDGGTTPTDAGGNDAGAVDAGNNDAGTSDAGTTDGGTTDGGAVTGTATINGTIPGSTNFTPLDAIVATDLQDNSSALIAISDVAGECALAQGNIAPKNAQLLGIQLHNQVSGQDAPLTTGTYNISTDTTTPDGLTAQSSFLTSDQTCNITPAGIATGGTVTVTTLNDTAGGSIVGSFSLQFPNAGTTTTTVTGTFDAPVCDTTNAPQNETCQP